jgi:hypothetical protein
MSTPQTDFDSVVNGVITALDARAHGTQTAQRAAKAQADAEAQQQAVEAAEAAKAQRRADELTLQTMEAHLGEIKAAIRAREELWKKFPIEIANLNCDLNRLLAQRQELRQKLGVI